MDKNINIIKCTDKKYLDKLYETWIQKLLINNIIFFELVLNLCYVWDNSLYVPLNSNSEAQDKITWLHLTFKNIDFIECTFGSIGVNNNGIPYLHMIIGFRQNYIKKEFLKLRIEETLLSTLLFDYKLTFLKNFDKIIKALELLSAPFKKEERNYPFAFNGVFSEHYQDLHDKFRNSLDGVNFLENYTCLLCLDNIGKNAECATVNYAAINNCNHEIFYYINLILTKNELIVFEKNLYKKVENSLMSYFLVGDIFYFYKNLKKLLIKVKDQLNYLDINHVCSLFSVAIKQVTNCLEHSDLFIYKSLTSNVIEFKDGIYLETYSIFISKKHFLDYDISEFTKFCFTTKFYCLNYKTVYKNLYPKALANYLLPHFSEDDFNRICLLISHFLTDSFITKNKNFFFEIINYSNSKILLLLVLKYFRKEYLNFINSNNIKTLSKKFIEQDANKNFLNVLFDRLIIAITLEPNFNQTLKKILLDNTLLKKIFFFFNSNTGSEDIKCFNQILDEAPKTILYCNKLYFHLLSNSKKKK